MKWVRKETVYARGFAVSIPWKGKRFGLVLWPRGWWFIGIFEPLEDGIRCDPDGLWL